jgi:hypothetical protein
VEPGGRLVEHVDAAFFTHVGRELEPLPLAARQRGEGLAEPQVAEPHTGHALEDRVRGRRVRLAGAEKGERFFDRQVEHLGDVELAELVVVLPRTVRCSQPSAAARLLPPPSVDYEAARRSLFSCIFLRHWTFSRMVMEVFRVLRIGGRNSPVSIARMVPLRTPRVSATSWIRSTIRAR